MSNRPFSLPTGRHFGFVLLLAAWALAPVGAQAATITVTTTAQSGPGCTLRDAIDAANLDMPWGGCPAGSGADVIRLPAGIYTLTAPTVVEDGGSDATGLPYIVTPMTIEGDGEGLTIIERSPDAVPFRLFLVRGVFYGLHGAVELRHLTLRGGSAVGLRRGGAVYTEDRPVTLRHVTVDGNQAHAGAGLGDLGMWGTHGGHFRIEDSTFTGNTAENYGAAIFVSPGGTLSVTRTTFAGNVAQAGGAIYSRHDGTVIEVADSVFRRNNAWAGAGGAILAWRLKVTRVRFEENTSRDSGGAFYIDSREAEVRDSTFVANSSRRGGAIEVFGRLTMSGSTFAGNHAHTFHGGAVYLTDPSGSGSRITNSTFSANRAATRGGAVSHWRGELTLNNVTVTGNRSDSWYGAGIGLGWNAEATLLISNSIVAANTAPDGESLDVHWDPSERLSSLGYNLIGSEAGTRGAFTAPGDIVGTPESPANPGLLPLADNGGPTETQALAETSLAANAGSPAPHGTFGACEPTDQRGAARPGAGGGACDAGAYEAQVYRFLTIDVTGPGGVAGIGTGVCTTSCVVNVAAGTEVTLTAQPEDGLAFLGWGGACSGTGDCRVTMDRDKAVTATFGSATPTNTPPTVSDPGNQTNTDADTISLGIVASDLDGDALTFGASNLPTSLAIDPTTGVITGTLARVTSDQLYTVVVFVSDGTAVVNVPFTWTITHAIPAPVVLDIMEFVGVSDTVVPRPSRMLRITENVGVLDSVVPRPSRMLRIVETVGVVDAVRPLPARLLRIAESVGVSDGVATEVYNTATGTDVVVSAAPGVTLTFAGVTRSGTTTAVPDSVPPPPQGFEATVPATGFEIKTTALFTGAVKVCLTVPTGSIAPELFHFESGAWAKRTTSVSGGSVCGSVSSLSPFAVFVPQPVEGRIHGNGTIDAEQLQRFDIRLAERGRQRGQVLFEVKAPRVARTPQRMDRFVSTSIDRMLFFDDPGFRSGGGPKPLADWGVAFGSGTWNGAPGYTFELKATDRGEPGRGRDSFEIVVRDPSGAVMVSASGVLTTGNIQSLRLRP